MGGGVGANLLIGGFKESITLQPLSVQLQEGFNIAAGIGSMSLLHIIKLNHIRCLLRYHGYWGMGVA